MVLGQGKETLAPWAEGEFARMWEVYLAMCSAQFELRRMNLLQLVYTRKEACKPAYRGHR